MHSDQISSANWAEKEWARNRTNVAAHQEKNNENAGKKEAGEKTIDRF